MGWDTRSEYYEEVDDDARDIVKQRGGTEDCQETISEWADNTCIYTLDCEDIVRFSRNDNALFDHMGSDALTGCDSVADASALMALFAYYQDVNDAIQGFDDDEVNEILERGGCENCSEVVPLTDLDDNEFCPDCVPLLQLAAVGDE